MAINKKDYHTYGPFKVWTIENFPFIEADFDAITNYQLYSKIVEHMRKLQANQNILQEANNELIEAFNSLEAYVNNYFDNLDVQEEINNKLDEMVEEGTLQEIISDYLNSKAVFCFDNVSLMTSSTNLLNGSYARTLGYNTVNDGGNGLYKIRTITNNDVVDGGLIIAMEDDTLVAELILENDYITPNQYGAIGDGVTDDTTYIQKAIDSGLKVKFISSYAFTHLTFNYARYNLDGNNKFIYYIGEGTESEAILFKGHHCEIKNLFVLNSTTYTLPCIRWTSQDSAHPSQFNYFDDIEIRNFELAIFFGASTDPSTSMVQSENYVNDFITRGVHRVLYCNQINGHITFTNSELIVAQNEALYTYVGDTSYVAECVEGAVHIYNSGINNSPNANGKGLVGKEFDIANCNVEVAGYAYYLNGHTKIVNTFNGFHGNYNVPYITINPDNDNTEYTVEISSMQYISLSNSTAQPFIKNNNSKAIVLVDNVLIKGHSFGSTYGLDGCYGNITNSLHNTQYLNYNKITITPTNYNNYLNVKTGTATVANDKLTITGTNGINVELLARVDRIIDIVSDIKKTTEGVVGINITLYKYNNTSPTITIPISDINMLTTYLNSDIYKIKMNIYSTVETTIELTKFELRGNNLLVTELLS